MKIFKLRILWDATYRQAVRMKSERYDRLLEAYWVALGECAETLDAYMKRCRESTETMRTLTEQINAANAEISRLRKIEAEYKHQRESRGAVVKFREWAGLGGIYENTCGLRRKSGGDN